MKEIGGGKADVHRREKGTSERHLRRRRVGGIARRILEVGTIREAEKMAVWNAKGCGMMGRGLCQEVRRCRLQTRKGGTDSILQ